MGCAPRGGGCVCEGHIYLDEIWAQDDIYFILYSGWLKYFTYHWLQTTSSVFCRWLKLDSYVTH
jgi:hypothetical protein